ncbi:MAG: hypothetical protein CM1200mP26_12390 [Acidimicrobiales bacterium]|nr:MAG: hypothetical protein CM1200mP26_12390 [Acidimicrobiales bacterium]
MTLHETVVDGVATITMDNPPVNALGVADTYGLATMLDSYRMRTEYVLWCWLRKGAASVPVWTSKKFRPLMPPEATLASWRPTVVW